MLKRLIEVALPIEEISEQAGSEKYIQNGSVTTLHLWWARRPVTACRAVIFASMVPDPDDPECPQEFRDLVADLLKESEFSPRNADGSSMRDTPRNRCLEFTKQLVQWENSDKGKYTEPARQLVAAAHKIFHPESTSSKPPLLDPFAGGGAIPLEALRLGCDTYALDVNPVAHLIELCTLVYPQRFGQPNSRPVPDYITAQISQRLAQRRAQGEKGLFDNDLPTAQAPPEELAVDVDITEEEYLSNPLATDVKYWGHWVLANARRSIGDCYPPHSEDGTPIAYLWARTVKCANPGCGVRVPIFRQLWLSKKPKRKVALRLLHAATEESSFEIVEDKAIDFDPSEGTVRRGQAVCPECQLVMKTDYLQAEGNAGRIDQQMIAVVSTKRGLRGQRYRTPTANDLNAVKSSSQLLEQAVAEYGNDIVPSEPLKVWSGVFNAPLYGLTTWGRLFNPRQLLALTTFSRFIVEATEKIATLHDEEYAKAVGSVLGTNFGRAPDHWSTLCTWNASGPKLQHVFGRGALPMIWDYAEANPFGGSVGDWSSSINWNAQNAVAAAARVSPQVAQCKRGSATALPFEDSSLAAITTDPPYYDSVPYSDLSDFFYVWHKRAVGRLYPDLFQSLLTPKAPELVSHLGSYPGKKKTADDYEREMGNAFSEMRRTLTNEGICCVMFAHKTTTAWEAVISAALNAGLNVTSSWPLHTESKTRLRAMTSAALASSVTLICRKRLQEAGDGLWDDVRGELKVVAQERLDFFWNQGIRGADFFISAIGPALSVFGKFARVIRFSGEEVTVGEFLDEVRGIVTSYALTKILHTTHTSTIDPESRFYVVWKWSYGDAKVPADESFKLAQALGMDTEEMWDKSGVLSKSGENVQCVTVEKRIKTKDLGEPGADGVAASLIDVLHRLCAFREVGDNAGMTEFLARSGQARNQSLWLVAQAVSEILPEGDKEKQLMQGLLNQKEGLEEATNQGKLF